MNGEVIKSFLVSLGFGVDDKSLEKFKKGITTATTKVALMAAAVKAAAIGTFMGIAKISEGFEEMGYQYRIIAPAINKALLLRRAMMSAYKDAGLNIVQAVQNSVKFNLSLTKTKYQLEAIMKSTAAKFFPMLTKQMDIFRTKISANMPKILAFLEKTVKFIFKAFEGVVILGTRMWSMLGRVWDMFERLDEATGGWSTKILAAVAAWKLLNLAFITTPIGMIITGLIGLLALYDDFMTWEEGGDSLFDWSKWVPAIDAFKKGLESGWDILKHVFKTVTDLYGAFKKLFSGDFKGFFGGMHDYVKNIVTLFEKFWGHLKNTTDFFGKAGSGIADAVGGLFGSTTPLGQGATASVGANQNVNQKTEIYVQGSGDAQATARAIETKQSTVNSNMVRNMKTAAR